MSATSLSNTSLIFDLQPSILSPHNSASFNPLSLAPPVHPGDLHQPNPWIVSTDFTDWLSRMPEEIFGSGANTSQTMEHSMPGEDVVKVEHNRELFCRPQDVIPQASEPECSNTPQQIASFPPESLQDFKHVLYNLLVEHYNNPSASTFLQPCALEEDGVVRHGFRFNSRQNPEKKLPELYAQHIRKARLDCEDQSSVFIQDLYKYYLRACVELLSKYFEKRDKYTYLYDDIPLFVAGETLEQAEERIKTMKTRARKKRRVMSK